MRPKQRGKHLLLGTADGMEQEADFMHAERRMMVVMDVQEMQRADIVRLDYGKTTDTKRNNSNDYEGEYAALFIKPKEIGLVGINELINSLEILGKYGILSSSLPSIITNERSSRSPFESTKIPT